MSSKQLSNSRQFRKAAKSPSCSHEVTLNGNSSMFNKGFLYQRLGTHLNLPSEPTEFKLSCRGGCAAKRHLAQQLVEQGELRVEPEQISGLVNATLEDKLGDRLPVSPIHVTAHNGLRGEGVRNFFCRWGQGAYFSQLSRCPGPRSTSPTQNLSNLGPLGPKNSPKRAQVGQNGDLKAPVVPNGWNRVEQRWNGLWEVQVEDFEPIWRSWVPPNLAQGTPKTAQIGPS